MFMFLKTYIRAHWYNPLALVLLFTSVLIHWVTWEIYRTGKLSSFHFGIWVFYVFFTIFNPYALSTTMAYRQVMSRLEKTRGKGSTEYVKTETGYCWTRGYQMAMKDAKQSYSVN